MKLLLRIQNDTLAGQVICLLQYAVLFLQGKLLDNS